MTGVTEDELMRGHTRQVRLADLCEMDRRRLMHQRIRDAELEAERLRVERDEWREEAQSLRRQLEKGRA